MKYILELHVSLKVNGIVHKELNLERTSRLAITIMSRGDRSHGTRMHSPRYMLLVIKSSWQSLGHDMPVSIGRVGLFSFFILLVCTNGTCWNTEPVHIRSYRAYHRKQSD